MTEGPLGTDLISTQNTRKTGPTFSQTQVTSGTLRGFSLGHAIQNHEDWLSILATATVTGASFPALCSSDCSSEQ